MNLDKEFDNFMNGKDAYSKDNSIGHITGSCWIINNNLDAVLLTHHKKLNIWIPTGGHSEGESEPLSIAIREGEEETGLKLHVLETKPFHREIHIIPQYKDIPKHKHYDYTFLFKPVDSEDFVVSDESNDLKWIPLQQVELYSNEDNVLFMRDKTINLIKSGNKTILK